jgi:hypothetical protein
MELGYLLEASCRRFQVVFIQSEDDVFARREVLRNKMGPCFEQMPFGMFEPGLLLSRLKIFPTGEVKSNQVACSGKSDGPYSRISSLFNVADGVSDLHA